MTDSSVGPRYNRAVRLAALLRWTGVAALALAVMVAVFWIRSPRATPVKVGTTVPDIELPFAVQAGQTRLSQYRGSALLVAFLDTACEVCPSWTDELERLSRRFNRRGLAVLGVALDQDDRKVDGLLRTHAVTFFMLRDPGQQRSRAAFGAVQPPEAYLVDPQGVVREVWHDWFSGRHPDIVAAVERVLPRGVGPPW
jgi:peroxiredoxin